MNEQKNQSAIIRRITKHVQNVLQISNHEHVIIAISGGIDSATVLYLLNESIPIEHIHVVHLYYFEESIENFKTTIKPLNIPKENILLYSIKDAVDTIAKDLQILGDGSFPPKAPCPQCFRISDAGGGKRFVQDDRLNKMRLGNIMARVRMTYLFDQAKKQNALVCGTENRTENLLGYFTRFGDAASDFEVINHLYKTQVRAIAKHLHVPEKIIDTSPSAGLWEGQTDEKELGFSYEEIDTVLRLYFDEKYSITEMEEKGNTNARKILEVVERNRFKQEVPYLMK
ncbi:MAG: NAD(+) synthase [Candidatus Roizmanbacteria bacterium]|nr:NAD(+) synthase [Candidatus Roizmanbacteria bacterium]